MAVHDEVVDAHVPHLDTPLAAVLALETLRQGPGWRRSARLRHAAESGRHGQGWRSAVKRDARSPLTVGLVAGGFGASVYVFAIGATIVQGDLAGVGAGLTLAGLTALLLGSIASAVVAVVRRRRWRAHAVVARFAEANGLPYRLVVDGAVLPPLVGDPPRAPGPSRLSLSRSGRVRRPHTDVVEARVRGRELLAGRVRNDRQVGHRRSSVVQVWVLVQLADAERARLAVASFRVQQWRRDHADLGAVQVRRHEDRVLLAVETPDGDPAALAVLLTGADDVLEAADAGAAHA